MAANTNPTDVSYVNTRFRNRCELLRGVYALLLDDKLTWESISSLVPADNELIEDGRASEGIQQISNAELIAFAQIEAALLTAVSDPAILALISKGCVRALELTLPVTVSR